MGNTKSSGRGRQIGLSRLTVFPSGVRSFVPIRSFISELSQRPDMAVILEDESHDDSVWITHWMNDDHVEQKGSQHSLMVRNQQ